MPKNTFINRFVMPVAPVLLLAMIGYACYFGSRGIEHYTLHQVVAAVSGTLYFTAIAFGTLYVYTSSQLRGATTGESILASFIIPFTWMTKEVLVLLESHPFIECLYWYVSPLHIWLMIFMAIEMGVASLIVRKKKIKRGEQPGGKMIPLLVIVAGLVIFVFMYAWGKGENLYVIFLEGYRLLFGSGI
ncbi:MAG: hypothetical protein ACOCX9_00825 [Spirochaetota bacterium]